MNERERSLGDHKMAMDAIGFAAQLLTPQADALEGAATGRQGGERRADAHH